MIVISRAPKHHTFEVTFLQKAAYISVYIFFRYFVQKTHPNLVVFLSGTLLSICYRTYFHTSKGHMTWIRVYKMPSAFTCASCVSLSGQADLSGYHTMDDSPML